jgi:hypothetical protein
MLDLVGGGLLGSVFGGLFRLAPELLKFFDRKDERKHELAMFTLQTDLERVKGQYRLEEKYVEHSTEQLVAIQEAFREQAETSKAAGKAIAAVSALVRPGVTWALFLMYATVKAAALTIAFQSGAPWTEVILKGWSVDDFAMLNMVISFWFVGRAIEKYQKQ